MPKKRVKIKPGKNTITGAVQEGFANEIGGKAIPFVKGVGNAIDTMKNHPQLKGRFKD